MKHPKEGTNWFFVDEAGDPVFFDGNGNNIVGQVGCSPILILGFIEPQDPFSMRRALADLHARIAADEYLKDVPSIAKTKVAFHAKDDVPEVREQVYKLIRTFDFKAQFIVARKIERVFRNTFHSKPENFYNYLVSCLFQDVMHRRRTNQIYFAKRGSKSRQKPFQLAIETGIARFENKHQTKVNTSFNIYAQLPSDEPCLQVIDYMNWAVYRAFTKKEMRYYNFVSEKVSWLVDIYDEAKYPKNKFDRQYPFDVKNISPL